MAIPKRAKKSTDGGKTAAMKLVAFPTSEPRQEALESVVAANDALRSQASRTAAVAAPTKPSLIRPLLPHRIWATTDDEDVPNAADRPKIPFDSQLWQWRDEGGFVHIKTGELREESEFIDSDAKHADDDSGDWDAPQLGGDDW